MKHIRTIWLYLLLVLLVYVVAIRFSELQDIIRLFRNAQPFWVVAAVLLQLGTYFSSARAYQEILKSLEFNVRTGILARLYLAMTFFTHILPVGSFSGTLYFTRVLKRLGLPEGQGAVASLIGALTGYLAFFILLLVSILYLGISGIRYDINAAELGSVLLAVVAIFVVADRFIVHREKVAGFLRRLLRFFHFGKRGLVLFDRFCIFMEDLGEGRALFLQKKRQFFIPVIFQIGVLLLDALTIFVIFLAFGERASFAVILTAYNLARFFGAISFLPGGIGTFEVAQIVTLKTLGVPLATATIVTLFFRLFSFWLPTPVGFYFYRKFQKNGNGKLAVNMVK